MRRRFALTVLGAGLLLLSAQGQAFAPPLDLARVAGWPWGEEMECIEYLAGIGDTAMSIAGRYFPRLPAGAILGAIWELNGSTVIEPGRTVWLPDPRIYGIGASRKEEWRR